MTVIDETWYTRPDNVPQSASAGGVVVRFQAGQVWVALVREGDYQQYILPKGKVEPGEDLVTAARREIEEEAGLSDLDLVEYLGARERLNFRRSRWISAHYFLFVTRQVETEPSDPDHVYFLEWYPLDDLPEMFWPDQRDLLLASSPRIRRLRP